MKNYNITEIKNLLNGAKTALVVVPQISIDAIGAALGLALSLKKKNIETSVYCPQNTDNNYSKLSGLDLLTDKIESNDLIVSVNHPLDQIEKVSYNDDGGHLNLVVQTKEGSEKIDNNNIAIQSQSSASDICFMLGDEISLGENAKIVNKGNWVFISPIEATKSWAKATLVDPDAPYCEIFTFLLPMLDLPLDMDSGKNLLIGLRVSTQSFAVNVSPESFEAGAMCLRATQPPPATVQPTATVPAQMPVTAQPTATIPAQMPVQTPAPVVNQTPISAVEKTGSFAPGTKPGQNKPNPVGMS
ncbi:hypothetical protein KJ642_03885 [Patescibacteria group bacterium]|nr:hypothetical protein [Patescibacteria group bacterium]MBU4390397.1 hypothetical protein [Patescibacteria group bacterium]